MKNIQVFRLGDEIPNNAKFIHIEHSTIYTGESVARFYYEVPVVEKKESKEDKHKEAIEEVIAYLNSKTGGKYTSKAKATTSLIRARLNEGRTVEDFKYVIDTKCMDWLDDPKMRVYLRPQTLFSAKFDGYLSTRSAGSELADAFSELDSFLAEVN